MVIISSIIMLNIKRDKPYIFHVLLGILLSVIIYYINNIFNIFGLTDKIPIYLSVFFPIIFLSIVSTIGLVKLMKNKFLIIIVILSQLFLVNKLYSQEIDIQAEELNFYKIKI